MILFKREDLDRLCNRIPGIAFSDSPKLKAIKAIPVYFLKEGKVKCSSQTDDKNFDLKYKIYVDKFILKTMDVTYKCTKMMSMKINANTDNNVKLVFTSI